MTITDEQKAKLLIAYREAASGSTYRPRWSFRYNQVRDNAAREVGYTDGLHAALEILGLSAEAEQVRKEVTGD